MDQNRERTFQLVEQETFFTLKLASPGQMWFQNHVHQTLMIVSIFSSFSCFLINSFFGMIIKIINEVVVLLFFLVFFSASIISIINNGLPRESCSQTEQCSNAISTIQQYVILERALKFFVPTFLICTMKHKPAPQESCDD